MIYLPYIHITNIISTYINHKYLPCNFINFINIYHIFTIHTISNIYHHIFTIYTSQIIISTPSSHQPSPKRQRHRPPFAPFAPFAAFAALVSLVESLTRGTLEPWMISRCAMARKSTWCGSVSGKMHKAFPTKNRHCHCESVMNLLCRQSLYPNNFI